MQLTVKLARVRIADDVWQSGDDILLPNITVSIGEDDRSSSCQFAVNDPGLLIGAKYREISVSQGGIIVPADLLGSTAPATGTGAGETPATATLGSTAGSDVPLAIVKECLRQGVTDPIKIAFILTTAEGESNFRYDAHNRELNNPNVPDKRYGGRGLVQITQKYNYEYFGKILGVDLVGNPDLAFRPDISLYLLVAGIKRGWCGRGGLDRWITGANSSIVNAYRAIQGGVWGSRYQRFFDRWLKDAPALIQQAGGTAAETAPPPADPMSAEPAATEPQATQQQAPSVEQSSKGTEIIIELAVGWGLTFKDAIAFHFIHTSTDTTWDASGAQVTVFGGQSVRWLLTRVPVTESFENMTFKQYLEARCRQFGLELEMEGDGLRYQHLSQDGQTHLQLILREARRIGFSIKEGTGAQSGKLIVTPSARPEFTGFIIDEEVLIKPARFTDKAREGSSGQPGATVSSPGTGTGEATTAIARDSGKVEQAAPESQAGTGNAANSVVATTGATAPPVGGTVQPPPNSDGRGTGQASPQAIAPTNDGTAIATTGTDGDPLAASHTEKRDDITRADGARVITVRIEDFKAEPGKLTRTIETRTQIIPEGGGTTASTRIDVIEITDTGRKIKTTIRPPDETTEKTEPLTAEDKRLLELSKKLGRSEGSATTPSGTGLPNQQAGAIDLLDGRAEAQALSTEAKRVKGYEDSYVLTMNMDTLQLVPGQIVALSKRLFPDAFATEKRVGTVEHNFGEGTTTINTYTPQAPPPGGAVQLASPAVPVNPGGFIFPIPRGATTIGDGYGTRARRAAGYRHTILDITAPGGTPVVAMADGVITRAVLNAGGAGHLMTIEHGGGYVATYMHGQAGQPFIVESGPVKQGQAIFRVGTTGGSSGNHLHLKFTLNGNYCLLSKVGLDVLNMGLPIRRYNEGCNQY